MDLGEHGIRAHCDITKGRLHIKSNAKSKEWTDEYSDNVIRKYWSTVFSIIRSLWKNHYICLREQKKQERCFLMQWGKINPPKFPLYRQLNEGYKCRTGSRLAGTDKYMHFVCLSHNHSPRRNWAFHKDSSAALKRVDEFGKVAGNHDNRESFAWQQSSLVASFHRKSVRFAVTALKPTV